MHIPSAPPHPSHHLILVSDCVAGVPADSRTRPESAFSSQAARRGSDCSVHGNPAAGADPCPRDSPPSPPQHARDWPNCRSAGTSRCRRQKKGRRTPLACCRRTARPHPVNKPYARKHTEERLKDASTDICSSAQASDPRLEARLRTRTMRGDVSSRARAVLNAYPYSFIRPRPPRRSPAALFFDARQQAALPRSLPRCSAPSSQPPHRLQHRRPPCSF